MQHVVPDGFMVREVYEHVGWYRVCVIVQQSAVEMLVSVDDMDETVSSYDELSMSQRQGFIVQAVCRTIDELNTFVLNPAGFMFIVPTL